MIASDSQAGGILPLTSADEHSFSTPGAFGPYRVMHQIGVGVLGPVFRTYDPSNDRLIAVKAFHVDITPEQAETLTEFLETLVQAELSHSSVVLPLDAGIEEGVPFIAQEYVASESLDATMRHYTPVKIHAALSLMDQLATAIDASHSLGLLHGSIHLRDIFVSNEAIKITGFGIGGALEQIGVRGPIRRPYTAPEVISGREWGPEADRFSLAAIAYELLTGKRAAGTGAQVSARLEEVEGIADIDALQTVFSEALSDVSEVRYASAQRFFSDLSAAVGYDLSSEEDELLDHGVDGDLTDEQDLSLKNTASVGAFDLFVDDSYDLTRKVEIDQAGGGEYESFKEDRTKDGDLHEEARSLQDEDSRLEEAIEIGLEDEKLQDIESQAEKNIYGENEKDDVEHSLKEFGELEEIFVAGASDEKILKRGDASESQEGVLDEELLFELESQSAGQTQSSMNSDDSRDLLPLPVVQEKRIASTDKHRVSGDGSADLSSSTNLQKNIRFGNGSSSWMVAFVFIAAGIMAYYVGLQLGSPGDLVNEESSRTQSTTVGVGSALKFENQVQTQGEIQSSDQIIPQPAFDEVVGNIEESTNNERAPEIVADVSNPEIIVQSENRLEGDQGSSERSLQMAQEIEVVEEGLILVRTNPSGALVILDGVSHGRTPISLPNVPLGNYQLEVSLGGFRTERREIQLSRTNSLAAIGIDLFSGSDGLITSTILGSVSVRSRPTGAEVLIDGKNVGVTPMVIDEVGVGSYEVQIKLEGYKSWIDTIEVVESQQIDVAASLDHLLEQ
tara:strand:+ start:2118 stop:4484 length:2367 start_codon:yes stop_codon:yes gene_type:complete